MRAFQNFVARKLFNKKFKKLSARDKAIVGVTIHSCELIHPDAWNIITRGNDQVPSCEEHTAQEAVMETIQVAKKGVEYFQAQAK